MARNNPPLRPITQKRVSDEAVEQVLELIRLGRLSPGDQLPSERELADSLKISRGAVREALRLLEARGALEVQPGMGTFVAESAGILGLSASWSRWLHEHREEVFDLLQVRSALEPLAAALAASKAKPDDVEAIGEAIERIEDRLAHGDWKGAAEGDIRFHELISSCGGNSFLISLNQGINVSLMEHRFAHYSVPGKGNQSNQEHRKVLEAIRDHDPERAAQAMRDHIENSIVRTRLLAGDPIPGRDGGPT